MSNHAVRERAKYEHFKSTPESPKYYITLRTGTDECGEPTVWYTPVYDFGTVCTRSEAEFLGEVLKDGDSIARFTLVQAGIITREEVNQILDYAAKTQ